MLLLLLLILVGCASTTPPRRVQLEDLPSMDEIGSRVTPIRAPRNPNMVSSFHAEAQVRTVTLPLSVSMHDAWKLVDETAVPRSTRAAWQANGLRVGVLNQRDLANFYKAIPWRTSAQQRRVIGSSHPVEFIRSPHLQQSIPVQLPGRAEGDTFTMRGGRARLLAAFSQGLMGSVNLELLPHHHLPQSSLYPRDPMESALDGRLFEELSLHLTMASHEVLVVGLHRPPPAEAEGNWTGATRLPRPMPGALGHPGEPLEPVERSEDDPSEMTRTGWDGVEQRYEGDGRDLPRHLGRVMMSGERLGDPVQRLLLITVAPASQTASRPAPVGDAPPIQ